MSMVMVLCPKLVGMPPIASGLKSGVAFANLTAKGSPRCTKCGGEHSPLGHRADAAVSSKKKTKKQLREEQKQKKSKK